MTTSSTTQAASAPQSRHTADSDTQSSAHLGAASQPAASAPTQTVAPSQPGSTTAQATAPAGSQSLPQSQSQSNSQSQSQSQQQQPQTAAQPQPIAPLGAPEPGTPVQAAPAVQDVAPTRYGVSLQDAAEAVRSTIQLGTSQGFTQAKIELSPGSLGTIRIQLHHTDDGVTAHVVADNAATADTLSQNSADLRRSLQQAGVNLLSLDIETRGDSGAQSQDGAQDSPPRATSGSRGIDAIGETDSGSADTSTAALPDGALVNVLA